MRIFKFMQGIILIIIFIVLFNGVNFLAFPYGVSYDNTLGFKKLENNSLDYVFIGSSHVYKGIVPEIINYKYNVNSYNYATSNNIIEYNEYQIKEILKTQKPKIIFLELFNLVDYSAFPQLTYDDTALHKAIDVTNVSLEKYKVYKENVINESVVDYLLPITKYHLEWKSQRFYEKINKRFMLKNTYRGYQYTTKKFNPSEESFYLEKPVKGVRYLGARQKYLDNIVNICKENNIELVFLILPYINFDIFPRSLMNEYKNGIDEVYSNDIYDLNSIELGLVKSDFYDESHLNAYGAKKVSEYLGEIIEKNYYTNTVVNEGNTKAYKEYYSKYRQDLLYKPF
ncbi:MAG: hypothetical protein ACK5LT_08695 [Lachnospirales bacterium]